MVALASSAAAFVFEGWVPGVILFALAVAAAIVLWTPVRGWLGIPGSHAPRLVVPDEHRDELRAAVKDAVNALNHPAPVFWPVDNARLKAATAAHFRVFSPVGGDAGVVRRP